MSSIAGDGCNYYKGSCYDAEASKFEFWAWQRCQKSYVLLQAWVLSDALEDCAGADASASCHSTHC